MKLFTRYFRTNLVATLIIFLLASTAFYFLLWFVMIRQVDEDLKIEQREIETYISKYNKLPEPISVKDQRISYEPSPATSPYRAFVTIPSPNKEEDNFREIIFSVPVTGQWYLFKVSKSLESTEHMNRSIVIISLLTVVAILIVNLLINRWQLRRLWKPFYSTLSGVQTFRLGKGELPSFEETKIDEFSLLNKTMDKFIQEADKEYFLLKEFTENASHELQTPLAIVRSTLDVLIQDEHLTETQSNAVQTAYAALQKMTKLNQSLLLLSKIENRQFAESRDFDFKTLVEDKINDWQELWQARNLTMRNSLQPAPVTMNFYLAEIMLNNLFGNAARHAAPGGTVEIILRKDAFIISNSAANGPLDPEKLFKRFSKGGQATDQHGIGLSIVKQITDASGQSIAYGYDQGRHVFTVSL
jgi:signal transduction histidine kinase